MSRPKVYLTRLIAKEAIDMISKVAEMKVWSKALPPPHVVLMKEATDVDGLLTLLTDKIDAPLMEAAPKLKVISNMAVGYDNIDIDEATRRGIVIGNTPQVLTETTADFAFTLLMAAARRIVEADAFTRRGRWKTWGPMIMLGQDIHDATLGIVGLGRIGKEMAKRAMGFKMKVLYCDQQRQTKEERLLDLEYVAQLPELLSRSDFISIHVPLTPKTFHLIGATEFAVMKPTAVLVNTSRGPVIDEEALYRALKSRRIFAAAMDVTECEPISPKSPLLTLENVIITPHIASASFGTRTKMAILAAKNLIAGLRGEILPECVNPGAKANVPKLSNAGD